MIGVDENLGEDFFAEHPDENECNCSWCKEMIPAYSQLYRLLEENHYGMNNKEIKTILDQIKENHECTHDDLGNAIDEIQEILNEDETK